MTNPPARSGARRRQDTLDRLANDVDGWIATAAEGGLPHLVPLSFDWDGEALLVATPAASPTARNLRATGRVRVGLGPTRDVVLIEAEVHVLAEGELGTEAGDAFAERTGFDPRTLRDYQYFRLRPLRIQAWREVNELAGRDLMRDGDWLVG